MLFFTICQQLSPILLMLVTENPTTIIFNLKYNNADPCCYDNIYLCIFTIRFLNIQIMKYCFRIDTSLQ